MGITDRFSGLFSSSDKEKKTEGTRSLPKKMQRKTEEKKSAQRGLTRFINLNQDIPNEELRKAYKYEACTHKGINKQANDCFEGWFELAAAVEEELSGDALDTFKNLENRSDMKHEFIRMVKQAMIYGTGYLEVVYANDDADVSEEPNGDRIEDLVLVDSDTIAPYVDPEVGSETHGEVTHYIQRIQGDEVEIHPDRIIHFPWDRVGTAERGISAIQPIYHVVKSKILLDQLTGDIPESVVNQIISINIEGADDDELDEAWEDLKEVQNAYRFAGTEKHDFDVHDAGNGLDIDPFTEHTVQQIATGLGIPKTILLGAEAGAISTAQINLRDYYGDIKNIRKRFEPVIRSIIDIEFDLQGIDEDYEIEWSELYTQDEKESEILLNKARAANQVTNPKPILDPDEVRDIFFDLEPREENEENEGIGDDYI